MLAHHTLSYNIFCSNLYIQDAWLHISTRVRIFKSTMNRFEVLPALFFCVPFIVNWWSKDMQVVTKRSYLCWGIFKFAASWLPRSSITLGHLFVGKPGTFWETRCVRLVRSAVI